MRRVVLPLAAVLVALAAVAWLVAGSSHSERPRPPWPPAQRSPAPSPASVATRFLTGLSLPVVEDRRRRDAYIARFAAPGHLEKLRSQYAGEAQRLAASFALRPRTSRTALVGYREHRDDVTHARVDVWAVSLGGAGDEPVAVGWQLLRVTLVRTGAGWNVAAVAQRPAPDVHVDGAAFATATAGFKEYRVAP